MVQRKPRKAHRWECADSAGMVVRVGDTVKVHFHNHNTGASEKGLGEVVMVQATPHHAVQVKFADGSREFVLGPYVEVQQC